MFIGHFAVGLAAKRVAPKTSLVWLLAAPLFLDLLWPLFLILGIERVRLVEHPATPFLALGLEHYPWSHSLVMALGWSVAFALVVGAGGDRRGALVAGALVFSHWILDYVTHQPDMALWPGGEARVGLGLWTSLWGTVSVEGLMFAGGVVLYLGATRARGKAGVVSFWSLVLFLAVMYVAATTGPPPPNVAALQYAGLATWILLPWAWWIERTREPRML